MSKNCHDCGAEPGQLHKTGCDVERCALCGGQALSCDCVYILAGIIPATMGTTHPDIYNNGATEQMWLAYDAEAAKYGGRLPWAGEWPGVAECREFGWFARMVPGRGWVSCSPEVPGAREDLNQLAVEARWDRAARRFVQKGASQ